MRMLGIGGLAVLMVGLGFFVSSRPEGEPCVPAEQVMADPPPSTDGELVGLRAELVVDGLDSPSDVLELPGSDSFLVAEKPGRVVIVDETGVVAGEPLLDIVDGVLSEGNEQGLVTIEAHPDFAENCRLYLFFTDVNGDSNLVEVRVSGTAPATIDRETMRTVLFVPQDQQYHQSGSVAFGPEGYLWVSIGDGGGIGDPHKYGQDPNTLEGTILRLDLSRRPYRIPGDNPFVGSDEGRPEVWAFGLRNPWRISIDEETGSLYIPDVGQASAEEVNVISLTEGGANFGWSITEGSGCFEASSCDTEEITSPTFEYEHSAGCAIIGGQVYRGLAIPELHGQYFFADFCRGWIKSIAYENGQVTGESDWEPDIGRLGHITSFGTDGDGEMYVTNLEGELWKIVPVRAVAGS